jgi:hypothetical protein
MRKTGSMNHVRSSVSDISHAKSFYDPLLRYMGYELAENSEERLAWKMPSPASNRQWVILSAASEEGRRRKHDTYSPGDHQPPQAFSSAYAIASSKPSRHASSWARRAVVGQHCWSFRSLSSGHSKSVVR